MALFLLLMTEEFLTPPDPSLLPDPDQLMQNQWGNQLIRYQHEFPGLKNTDLAIIGVQDDRGEPANAGSNMAPDAVRKELYKLYRRNNIRIADLGNIKQGHTKQDTYVALGKVCEMLLRKKIIPIVIGGSHDNGYGQYKGYEKLDEIVNLVNIDERVDLSPFKEDVDAGSFLLKLLTDTSSYIFNYTQLGYQTYFTDEQTMETMNRLQFDCFRLGEVHPEIEETEPIVRDADLLLFDMNAIRSADAPGHRQASPNGFTGEEACRICRYAGLSDKLTSIGFYEYNPAFDRQGQTAQLLAQMIWYFVDGFYNRKQDDLLKDKSDFVKYLVDQEGSDQELIFWKSRKTGRWWMEIPYTGKKKLKKHHFVPCTYKEYELACKDEVPERWLKIYQKLD